MQPVRIKDSISNGRLDSQTLGRDISHTALIRIMAFRSVHLRILATPVDDVELISEATSAILPEEVELIVTPHKSHHGALQTTIEAHITRKRDIRIWVERIGATFWEHLLADGISKRIDDDKFLHLRLDLPGLVGGRYVFAHGQSFKHPLKIKIKIESYPGMNTEDEAKSFVRSLLSD